MKVKLTIFKPHGTYYTDSEYETNMKDLHQIWDEVKTMVKERRLPGLVPGSCWTSEPGKENWMVSVDVPDHQHNHPHIIRTINDQ